MDIDLRTPLSLRSSFAFPLQTPLARREVVWGAVLLLVPGVGWILNMGHRIALVHNMLHGRDAWPAWRDHGALFRHGLVTFGGMLYYHLPSFAVGWLAWRTGSAALWAASVVLSLLAIIAIPGYMTHYCHAFDAREIYSPARALSRVAEGGRAYWHAWGIALAALALSFLGLLALGVGFLATSVWFWQVAGFSFARVFSRKLLATPHPAESHVPA
ncbi:MAG TPA: hypothetical protein VFQ39_13930, partial [Longimicrobium sp.]|nr:hypothetical protein [Longimicrobium sp.]